MSASISDSSSKYNSKEVESGKDSGDYSCSKYNQNSSETAQEQESGNITEQYDFPDSERSIVKLPKPKYQKLNIYKDNRDVCSIKEYKQPKVMICKGSNQDNKPIDSEITCSEQMRSDKISNDTGTCNFIDSTVYINANPAESISLYMNILKKYNEQLESNVKIKIKTLSEMNVEGFSYYCRKSAKSNFDEMLSILVFDKAQILIKVNCK